ncbi:MAG: hypothetical protein AVDCRST_MAG16-3044, partial [uncultured Frankineae bacterium]
GQVGRGDGGQQRHRTGHGAGAGGRRLRRDRHGPQRRQGRAGGAGRRGAGRARPDGGGRRRRRRQLRVGLRRDRCPDRRRSVGRGQQRRLRAVRSGRGRHRRAGPGAAGDQRRGPDAHRPAGAPADEGARRGPHRQHQLGRRPHVAAPLGLVLRVQARAGGGDRRAAHGGRARRGAGGARRARDVRHRHLVRGAGRRLPGPEQRPLRRGVRAVAGPGRTQRPAARPGVGRAHGPTGAGQPGAAGPLRRGGRCRRRHPGRDAAADRRHRRRQGRGGRPAGLAPASAVPAV